MMEYVYILTCCVVDRFFSDTRRL